MLQIIEQLSNLVMKAYNNNKMNSQQQKRITIQARAKHALNNKNAHPIASVLPIVIYLFQLS